MRVIFMGTPDFAAASLAALIREEKIEVVCAVTQPDKPKGRKAVLTPSEVKVTAEAAGIPVLQPRRVREPGFDQVLADYKPDVIVVVAFGQIIPKSILDLPTLGCVNVHGSLLPRYRGAAPIQWAVLNGEKESGVTTMLMDEGLDTGDILLQRSVVLDRKETSGSLFERLKDIGAELLVETLYGLEAGTITPVKQGETTTAYAKMLKKEMGLIDFSRSAEEIDCLIRGMDPWPAAYTTYEGKTMKLWDADPVHYAAGKERPEPGTVIFVRKNTFTVACGDGALDIKEVQLEGKKRMSAANFIMGNRMEVGTVLGK